MRGMYKVVLQLMKACRMLAGAMQAMYVGVELGGRRTISDSRHACLCNIMPLIPK